MYGNGYPLSVVGKVEHFDINIIDNNGSITGACNDPIVAAREGNESTIEGTFKDKIIRFLKKYKYPSIMQDRSGMEISADDVKFEGIHYTGKMYKKIFSGTPYFSGEWCITSTYIDKRDRKPVEYTVGGTWTMIKTG